MIVEFVCEDGVTREIYFYSHEEVCATGESMEFEDDGGHKHVGRRLPASPGDIKNTDYQFFSRQPKKWHPDAPMYTKEGYPAFNTKKQADEFAAKSNARGENWTVE